MNRGGQVCIIWMAAALLAGCRASGPAGNSPAGGSQPTLAPAQAQVVSPPNNAAPLSSPWPGPASPVSCSTEVNPLNPPPVDPRRQQAARNGWASLAAAEEPSLVVLPQQGEPIPAPASKSPAPASNRPKSPVLQLSVPTDLPGADAAPIRLPPPDPQHPKNLEQAVDRMFPPLAPLGAELYPQTGPALTLADLERMAEENNPLVRQAESDVSAAEGQAIQAGAYPNPNVGYEGDTIDQGGTAGQQGVVIEQEIKTAGKLKLARAAAMAGVEVAQLALRKARLDLATQVRANYFAVLVAQENVKVSTALARMTDDAYRIQVEMVKGGEAAAYEPMQLRVQTYQSRVALVQARNRYVSACKQLAANLGMPGMPPPRVAGRVDLPVPVISYDAALARVLSSHTDVLTAETTIRQQKYNLALAEVTPIPDLMTHVAIQHDYTTPPFLTTENVSLEIALPLWDKNEGNIRSADAALARAMDGPHQVRDDLATKVADAFERYSNGRTLLGYYRTSILPDQVRAYQGVYRRHQQEPDVVAFGDVVSAQQTLAQTISAYIGALGDQWTAVVDLAGLLQIEDFLQIQQADEVSPIPDMERLNPPPADRNAPAPPGAATGPNSGTWPAAAPEDLRRNP